MPETQDNFISTRIQLARHAGNAVLDFAKRKPEIVAFIPVVAVVASTGPIGLGLFPLHGSWMLYRMAVKQIKDHLSVDYEIQTQRQLVQFALEQRTYTNLFVAQMLEKSTAFIDGQMRKNEKFVGEVLESYKAFTEAVMEVMRRRGVSLGASELPQPPEKVVAGPWAGAGEALAAAVGQKENVGTVEESATTLAAAIMKEFPQATKLPQLDDLETFRPVNYAPVLLLMSFATAMFSVLSVSTILDQQKEQTAAAYTVAKNGVTEKILNMKHITPQTEFRAVNTYEGTSPWHWGSRLTETTADATVSSSVGNYVTLQFDDGTSQKYHIISNEKAEPPPRGYETGVVEFKPASPPL